MFILMFILIIILIIDKINSFIKIPKIFRHTVLTLLNTLHLQNKHFTTPKQYPKVYFIIFN